MWTLGRNEIECLVMNRSTPPWQTRQPRQAGQARQTRQNRVGILLSVLALFLPACAKMVDYNEADAPLHQGSHGEPVPARVDSFRVVSYNIQYGEDIDLALDDLEADPLLDEADIILLQEMDPEGTEAIARALGRHFVYYPAAVHPHHARLFGNAVLSRWPITAHSVLMLPHGHPFSGHRRIAVAADVDLGGVTLHVVSVHLATVVMPQDERLEQVTAALDSLGAASGPTIIGGDFNTITSYEVTLVRRIFRRAGFRWARLPPGSTVKKMLQTIVGQDLILDHIFYRELQLLDTGIAEEAEASDHLPISALFGWQPTVTEDPPPHQE